MSEPKVGLTHDVVIYPSGGLAPVGLVINPFTFRVSNAPDFVPRLAQGDARGLDYSGMTSWVQEVWDGRHGLDKADGHGYRRMVGFRPSAPSGVLYAMSSPVRAICTFNSTPTTVGPDIVGGEGNYPNRYELRPPMGKVPLAIHNVATSVRVDGMTGGWFVQETRPIIGARTFEPRVNIAQPQEFSMRPGPFFYAPQEYIFDAVEYSTIGAYSVYYNSTDAEGDWIWGDLRMAKQDNWWKPVGYTTAGALGVYDKKLWRSEPYGDKISYYTPQESTLGLWSGYTQVQPGIVILAMEEFIGRLMIGASNGLYAYEVGRTYLVADFSSATSRRNFTVMKVISGALYFNIDNRMFRYTSGGLLEEIDTPFYVTELPMAIAVGEQCIYFLVGNLGTGSRRFWRMDLIYGSFQEVFELDSGQAKWPYATGPMGSPRGVMPTLFVSPVESNVEIAAPASAGPIIVGPVLRSDAGSVDYLDWLVFDGNMTTFTRKRPITEDNTPYYAAKHVETGYIDLGYPLIYKTWVRTRITVTKPENPLYARMELYYRGRDAHEWTIAPISGTVAGNNTVIVSSAARKVMLEFDLNDLVSKEIEIKPVLRINPFWHTLADGTGEPFELNKVEVDALFVGPQKGGRSRKEYTFDTMAVEPIQLLNGEVENSLAYITATLWSVCESGALHVVALPYPPPVGHTVKARVSLGDRGVVVPILAYSTAGVVDLASVIPIKVLEM